MNVRRGTVHCVEHGETEPAFVCGHLVRGVGLGFFVAYDPGNARPHAWCGACEALRIRHGGEWPEEVERSLGVTLLCGGCYDRARDRNLGSGNRDPAA
jgi:hypothetical protein